MQTPWHASEQEIQERINTRQQFRFAT